MITLQYYLQKKLAEDRFGDVFSDVDNILDVVEEWLAYIRKNSSETAKEWEIDELALIATLTNLGKLIRCPKK